MDKKISVTTSPIMVLVKGNYEIVSLFHYILYAITKKKCEEKSLVF